MTASAREAEGEGLFDWASLLERFGREGGELELRRWIVDRLEHGPAAVAPWDVPRRAVTLELWLSDVVVPLERARSGAFDPEDGRAEPLIDEFVSLELRRLTAIIALAELGWMQIPAGHWSAPDSRRVALLSHYVFDWLDDVRSRSDRAQSLYWRSWRSRDERTYGPLSSREVDPAIAELVAFVFQVGEPWHREKSAAAPRVRAAFCRRDLADQLPALATWLLERYEVVLAKELIRALLDDCVAISDASRRSLRGLRWQARFLPRLACAVFVGQFAIVTQSGFLAAMVDLLGRPWLAALYCGGVLVIVAWLLRLECRAKNPLRRGFRRFTGQFILQGLMVSAVLTVPFYALLLRSHAVSQALGTSTVFDLVTDVRTHVGLATLIATTSFLFAYVLQLLWDERPITGPI